MQIRTALVESSTEGPQETEGRFLSISWLRIELVLSSQTRAEV